MTLDEHLRSAKEFGEWVKTQRLAENLSVRDVADAMVGRHGKAGMSITYLRNIEAGRYPGIRRSARARVIGALYKAGANKRAGAPKPNSALQQALLTALLVFYSGGIGVLIYIFLKGA